MSVSDVSFNEDVLIVTVDDTAPPQIAITPEPILLEIAGQGLQGPPGPAGGVGPAGPQGPQGIPGTVAGNLFYKHDQMLPSDTWTVTHNLGYRPNVSVQDSAYTVLEGHVQHVSDNELIVTFSAPFSGTANCS